MASDTDRHVLRATRTGALSVANPTSSAVNQFFGTVNVASGGPHVVAAPLTGSATQVITAVRNLAGGALPNAPAFMVSSLMPNSGFHLQSNSFAGSLAVWWQMVNPKT